MKKKPKLHIQRLKILDESKKYIIRNGWNEDLFKLITKNSNYEYKDLTSLFPEGHLSLLEFFLNDLNDNMTHLSKKINLKKMRIHKRIRELILLRLRINRKDNDLIKRTYFALMLPQYSKIAYSSLYSTVDQMWFLVGDTSTDFNFYTKRAILASVYSLTIFYSINNDVEKSIKFLDYQLKKVSKIPLIKNKIRNISEIFPFAFKLINKSIVARR